MNGGSRRHVTVILKPTMDQCHAFAWTRSCGSTEEQDSGEYETNEAVEATGQEARQRRAIGFIERDSDDIPWLQLNQGREEDLDWSSIETIGRFGNISDYIWASD